MNFKNWTFFQMYFTKKSTWIKLSFIFIGLVSSIWFLIRVLPKPQRAAYPCMKASAPIMSAFIMYLLSLSGFAFAFKKSKDYFKKARYSIAFIFLGLALGALGIFLVQKSEPLFAKNQAEWIIKPNAPIGKAKGIFPGRVVWVHDPAVAHWDGTTIDWWNDKFTSQVESEKMIKKALNSVTGKSTEKDAWNSLFISFNKTKKNKEKGYQPEQKIAIKINTNNTYKHEDSEEINATPQMVLALLKSLINEAGVPQNKITVFDASRFITNNIFDKCHLVFPEVIFVDNIGGDGRVKSTYVDSAIRYSQNNGRLAQGIATCATEADYLINMALLKGHVGQGVTLCAKNYYGVTSIYNDWRKNAHDNFNQDRQGKPKYMTFVDFLAHKDLGEKTMLFLIDGVYGTKAVNGVPGPKWQMAPFNNHWSASLLASQDPVAIDAVALDLLRSEWPDLVDIAFSDSYLIEAALADNPPSNTKYDPQLNGAKVTSLGVMEHWNNSNEMKYSRNLGKKEGIELIKEKL